MKLYTALFIIFQTAFTFTGYCQPDSLLINERTPSWAKNVLVKSELFGNYTILDDLNPFYFEVDLNGDDLTDIVFRVKHKLTGDVGIFVINGGKNLCFVMGAGKPIGMGSNIDWCNKWFIFRDKAIYNFDSKKVKTVIRTPGIELRKTDSKSVIIYWDRRKYIAKIKST
ncbi:MAG: hypothetical protein P8M19_05545 [Crocinitomicaceae bacterium]|nr:hypothetical protein [Crocinitomicaceae bacterium]MDG1659149.1 hypothetical protein [Crocinitomicaceae bacterium]MDG2441115.1 hypothetical protein [Crocinitomicaceae bacterium]